MRHNHSRLGIALATATLIGLSACGGGSSGSSPAAVTTTTFSGTAATGRAMANAAIRITCASGSGSTTAATDGSYSTAIASITLPCALQATGSDGTVLYSVTSATATGSNTQVANITPLTQLLVASLSGMDPATFFSNVSSTPTSLSGVVTDSAVATAQTAVLALLTSAGISTASLPNLISGSLVAGSASSVYDVALDALQTLVTSSGTSLATLTSTVAASSTATTTTSSTVSLPANLLLKAAASNCAALRSGDYVVVGPTPSATLADQFDSFSLNATTLTATNSDTSTDTLTASTETCRFTGTNKDVVVSQAGIVLLRALESGVYRLRLALPKQTIAVSELAGAWNALSFEADSSLYSNHALSATVGSTGTVSDLSYCTNATPSASCSNPGSSLQFSSNSAGGFDMAGSSSTGSWTNRAFAYRAGNGSLMLAMVGGDGSISLWTRQRTNSLPTVGTVNPSGWSVYANSSLVANTLGTNTTFTNTAVDSTTGSITRTINRADGTADYNETVVQNSPRNGYNFRAATSTTSSYDSRTVAIRERTSLGLRGMGISVQAVPLQTGVTAERFQISVDQLL